MRKFLTAGLAAFSLMMVAAVAGCGGGGGVDGLASLITVDSDGTVRVKNPLSVPNGLTDSDVKPVVDSIEPASGVAGTVVTVHGKNFAKSSSGYIVVVVRAKNLLNVQVTDNNTLTGTIPQQNVCGDAGSVTVATPYGPSSWDASHVAPRFSYICENQ